MRRTPKIFGISIITIAVVGGIAFLFKKPLIALWSKLKSKIDGEK